MIVGRIVSIAMALFSAIGFAQAQDLPPAEISQSEPSGVVTADSAVVTATDAPAEPNQTQYLEIYSRGHSRFEISDDGHILVVYGGGVEFSYRGFKLRADELRFDQAELSALVTGDVRATSDELSITTQRIELDGIAGRATVAGHLVGSFVRSGIRFEADRAELTFPPRATEVDSAQSQLTLAGNVAIYGPNNAVLRTDQVAFDGATRRFSTAPFILRAEIQGRAGQPGAPLQVTGTAASGLLASGGGLGELTVLGMLAVTPQGRLSAARAVAKPDPASGAWLVEASGSPIRLELTTADLTFPSKTLPPETPPQPVTILAQSNTATVEIDGSGLRTAALADDVIVSALGNRLALTSVSVSRRDAGFAISAGGVRLGLDLARLAGIQPVDLSQLID